MFKVLVMIIFGAVNAPTDDNFTIVEVHTEYATLEACEAVKQDVLVDTLVKGGVFQAFAQAVCTDLSTPEYAEKYLGIPVTRIPNPSPFPPPVI